MITKRNVSKLLHFLPVDDKASEILYQESNPEYLSIRAIEELRSLKLITDRPIKIKGLQRTVLMLLMALQQISEQSKNDARTQEALFGVKTSK